MTSTQAARPEPLSGPSRVAAILALIAVGLFVVLEYVYDWPIHLAR